MLAPGEYLLLPVMTVPQSPGEGHVAPADCAETATDLRPHSPQNARPADTTTDGLRQLLAREPEERSFLTDLLNALGAFHT